MKLIENILQMPHTPVTICCKWGASYSCISWYNDYEWLWYSVTSLQLFLMFSASLGMILYLYDINQDYKIAAGTKHMISCNGIIWHYRYIIDLNAKCLRNITALEGWRDKKGQHKCFPHLPVAISLGRSSAEPCGRADDELMQNVGADAKHDVVF